MDGSGVTIAQAASAGGTFFMIGVLFGWLWAKLHHRHEREE
jgi:hypothetical protein